MNKISYLLNIILVAFFLWYFFFHVGIEYYIQKYLANREFFLDDIYYKAKTASFENLNKLLDKKKKYIVIVGDSIIEQFPLEELLGEYSIINRGVGKDTSRGLLERLCSNINNINMSHCLVMIGHNDLKYRDAQETFSNVSDILRKLKSEKIYFLSILPDSNINNNIIIESLNKSIEKFCFQNNFIYIDIFDQFISEENWIDNKYYIDGVHLNISGYRIISKHIKKILEND